jgi:hypothetical protein
MRTFNVIVPWLSGSFLLPQHGCELVERTKERNGVIVVVKKPSGNADVTWLTRDVAHNTHSINRVS